MKARESNLLYNTHTVAKHKKHNFYYDMRYSSAATHFSKFSHRDNCMQFLYLITY